MAYRELVDKLGRNLTELTLEFSENPPINYRTVHEGNCWYIKYAVTKVREMYPREWMLLLKDTNPLTMSFILNRTDLSNREHT